MERSFSYGKQHIDQEDIQAVIDVLQSDYLTQGPRIDELEKTICDYTGARYCVAVANGTAALHLAVAALELPPGSEGITSPNTFVASANCIAYCGHTPRFADIDTRTYCIDPDEIEKQITRNTKVLIPVHFAGQPANMPRIKAIADKHGLRVIEDAAHAIGSRYADGTAVGSNTYADLTTFSFHPVKTVTTAEGGAITTNDDSLYQKLLMLRTHGITKDPTILTQNPGPWYHEMHLLGYNYRLSDIHAALGISQMRKLDAFTARRRELVNRYNAGFADTSHLTTPYEAPGVQSVFHLYVLHFDFAAINKTRAEIMQELQDAGIGTQVHYIPVHTQPYYQSTYGTKPGMFPKAETYYAGALSMPLYPDLSNEDVEYIIDTVKKIIKQ